MPSIQDLATEFQRRVADAEKGQIAAINRAADASNEVVTSRSSRVTEALNRLATATSDLHKAQAAIGDALDELTAIENETSPLQVKAIESLYALASGATPKRKQLT